jgi:hypothetical protein
MVAHRYSSSRVFETSQLCLQSFKDYPSIGEINQKISENNVNLIFAVVPDQVNLYKNLSELIEGSFVGELNTDSSNIVALVVDIYKVGDVLKDLGSFRFHFKQFLNSKDNRKKSSFGDRSATRRCPSEILLEMPRV